MSYDVLKYWYIYNDLMKAQIKNNTNLKGKKIFLDFFLLTKEI